MQSHSKKVNEFYKRWNISVDEDAEFQRFKNRIITTIDRVVGRHILQTSAITDAFVMHVGHKCIPTSAIGLTADLNLYGFDEKFVDNPVFKEFNSTKKLQQLVFAIQCLFWALEENKCPLIGQLVKQVQAAIDVSPCIDMKVVSRGARVTIYPAGAELLDQMIVNSTLEWLAHYPAVTKHFESALQIYSRKDTSLYRNLLDELRAGLEKLFQNILQNKKTLENQKELLLNWLESKGVHVQIRNLYEHLVFKGYVRYQNDAVKHGEGWSEFEVEYMIYLTGAFMRLLLELKGK